MKEVMSKEVPAVYLHDALMANDTLRVALHDLEKRQEELKLALEVARREREAVAVELAGLRRDAARWRWAKEHPGIAVYIFDIQWMEQRDFDAAIDAEMQQAAPIKPCPNCKPCDFGCDAGKWELNGQAMDCYGCDGSGIDTRCEKHKDKHDDE